ncbi:MAG: aminomethyltransferase [Verrucomicrobiales bacterium]
MPEENSLKRSPLHQDHVRLGGKIVPFSGWEMPVHYTGIIDEHQAVRSSCGVFDISHMGQFFVNGPAATAWLDSLLTNHVASLEVGQAQYTFLLNEDAGVIDDLIVYRIGEQDYLLIVNAAKVDEDAAWMEGKLTDGASFADRSDFHGALAVQGPDAAKIYEEIFEGLGAPPLPPRNGVAMIPMAMDRIFVCRTGYTGEDGFELVCPAESTSSWLHKIISAGAKPCGLGARDSLRLEMGYPLNGSDLSPDHTPLEAGLGFAVKLNKGAFTGSKILTEQKENGIKTKLVGFEMIDKGPPPRPHYSIEKDGEVIAEIASGGVSPSMKKGIGMAYLPIEHSKLGTEINIDIRGRKLRAKIVKKPFYKK